MKISYLSTFYPFRGGITQFNTSLYKILEEKHEVRAYTFTRQYPDVFFPGTTQYVTESDTTERVSAKQTLDSINPFSYYQTASLIASFTPDLLLMKFWMPFFSPSLGTVANRLRKKGTKVITVLDNLIPHEKRLGDIQLIKYFLKRNDGFIAMSHAVKKDLLDLKPDAKYTLKPHPIYDHFGNSMNTGEARKKLGIPDDKKVILFFGFIRSYKGLDLAIEAMAYLPDDYLLVVAGEMYGKFDEYQTLIDQTGTDGKIKLFIRYINDNEVPAFFSAADAAVLPYKSATQSGIAQIAYHFNLPLIATNVGGLSEIIENGKTGLVLDHNTGEELAAKIKYYFDHKLKETFVKAITRKKEEFTWKAFADEVIQLYQKL